MKHTPDISPFSLSISRAVKARAVAEQSQREATANEHILALKVASAWAGVRTMWLAEITSANMLLKLQKFGIQFHFTDHAVREVHHLACFDLSLDKILARVTICNATGCIDMQGFSSGLPEFFLKRFKFTVFTIAPANVQQVMATMFERIHPVRED